MRVDALARLELAALGHQRQHLVVAEAQDIIDARAAVAVGALHVAGVGDLAAAGGVERRLDKLDQDAAVLARHGANRGLPRRWSRSPRSRWRSPRRRRTPSATLAQLLADPAYGRTPARARER